ncbi:hypothetical protein E1B28_002738 [Marasmius oreades]|uniref:Uncharacterized protein n=1 Tax=Marasmius oreades TaxID=181124 RepID=A0A9P7RP98_9AGAR|nr:uncharacterized protein E1B28_002738 [Marasmius oreades]KAG7086815.1 hypothetical protein E1B28_002738 [Marasmius oreades]
MPPFTHDFGVLHSPSHPSSPHHPSSPSPSSPASNIPASVLPTIPPAIDPLPLPSIEGIGEDSVGDQSNEHHSFEVDAVPAATTRSRMGEAEKALKGKTRTECINTALVDYLNDTEQPEICKIALEHKVNVRRVQQLQGRVTSLKNRKAPSAYNAVYRKKAQELNIGVAKGHRAGPKEIHAAVKADEELQEILQDPVLSKELQEDMEATRDERIRGARFSNKAAATDAVRTLTRITQEVNDLSSRTGACAFGFITRGGYDSSIEGGFFARGPVQEFLQQCFHISIWDFVSMAEGFFCKEEKLQRKGPNGKDIKSKLAQMITERFREITGGKGMVVNYVHYKSQVVEKFKVHIVGWPENGPSIMSPYSLPMADARMIYDLWRTNSCQWKKMSAAEYKAFVTEINKLREDGADVDPQRTKRSDYGGTHKRKYAEDTGGSRKRLRTGGSTTGKAASEKSKGHKSKETISDSDSGSESGEEEGCVP